MYGGDLDEALAGFVLAASHEGILWRCGGYVRCSDPLLACPVRTCLNLALTYGCEALQIFHVQTPSYRGKLTSPIPTALVAHSQFGPSAYFSVSSRKPRQFSGASKLCSSINPNKVRVGPSSFLMLSPSAKTTAALLQSPSVYSCKPSSKFL